MIDLHMHTVYSDGASTPEALVQAIVKQNLKAIAVTDHDNMDSLEYVIQAAEGTGLEIIPGIEINTHWNEKEIHVLGYYVDPNDPSLKALMNRHRQARVEQMQQMAKKLQKAGVKVTFEDIRSQCLTDGMLGRPHVARAMLEKGAVSNISEAFNRYLNPHAKTYVSRETATPHEAVEAIYESGGIPVIAHPGDMENIDNVVIELMDYGLRGLEAYHRSHSPALIEFHCTLAEKYGLIVTGGTDFHGIPEYYPRSYNQIRHMPPIVYEELKNEHRRLGMSAYKAS